jgi:hypothetical protein
MRANNELISKPSLLINNITLRTLQAIIPPEIININPIITSEPVITTSSPIIVKIIFRSRILYIRNPNTTYRNIYQKNKRLRRLDLGIEISISSDLEILATLINALVVLIYSILLKPKVKRVIKAIRTN